jgi:hypothetical protein
MRAIVVAAALLFGCGEEGGLIRVPISGRFEPAAIDFGEVPLGGAGSIAVEIVNTGEASLSGLEIASAPGFELSVQAGAIRPGQRGNAVVSFVPIEAGDATAMLSLEPDSGDAIQLAVSGRGVVAPILSAHPAEVDFSAVDLGGEARATIAIRNTGQAPGTVSSASLSSNEFTLVTPVAFTVPAGSSSEIEIAYRPDSAGEHTATLELESDAFEPIVRVDLRGSVQIGALVCAPEAIDLGGVVRGDSSQATLSCVSTGSLRLLRAELLDASPLFTIESPSEVELAGGASLGIRVSFSASGPQSDHEETLVLAYRNAEGEQRLAIPLRARVLAPTPEETAISLFLFWDRDLTDMDLHLVRPGGTPFGSDGSDCYFQRPTSDWGVAEDLRDDPFLDRDDLDGRGPENINLGLAEVGAYEVYVHYYADNRMGVSDAAVEVHAGGALLGVFGRPLGCDDLWHVGTLSWDGAGGSFVTSEESVAAGRGLCF